MHLGAVNVRQSQLSAWHVTYLSRFTTVAETPSPAEACYGLVRAAPKLTAAAAAAKPATAAAAA
jgi:hypothetical protein